MSQALNEAYEFLAGVKAEDYIVDLQSWAELRKNGRKYDSFDIPGVTHPCGSAGCAGGWLTSYLWKERPELVSSRTRNKPDVLAAMGDVRRWLIPDYDPISDRSVHFSNCLFAPRGGSAWDRELGAASRAPRLTTSTNTSSFNDKQLVLYRFLRQMGWEQELAHARAQSDGST